MFYLLTVQSLLDWLGPVATAALISYVITTSSGRALAKDQKLFEKERAKRDYLMPLFEEFIDNVTFEYIVYNIDVEKYSEWLKFLEYIQKKVITMQTIITKFDLILSCKLQEVDYITMWEDMHKKVFRVGTLAVSNLSNKGKEHAMSEIKVLADYVLGSIMQTEKYLKQEIKKYFDEDGDEL